MTSAIDIEQWANFTNRNVVMVLDHPCVQNVYQVESLNSVVNFYGQFSSDFLSEFGFLSTGKSILTRFPLLRNEQHLIRRSNKLFSTKRKSTFQREDKVLF